MQQKERHKGILNATGEMQQKEQGDQIGDNLQQGNPAMLGDFAAPQGHGTTEFIGERFVFAVSPQGKIIKRHHRHNGVNPMKGKMPR
ncbi:MAG: hypothetical protein M0R76_02975 [Proteobacteria bacterium]|nr:hypothetical protein [Pseudomonadota bacterium]